MLRTKAAVSMDEMGDQYCMVGPYVEKGVKMEVEVEDPVKSEPMATAINKMKEYGFRVSLVFNLNINTTVKCALYDVSQLKTTNRASHATHARAIGLHCCHIAVCPSACLPVCHTRAF